MGSRNSGGGRVAALFLLPYLLVFVAFRLGPSVAGIGVSFTKWNIVGKASFVGVRNFVRLFHDHNFVTSLINTFDFLLLTVPALIIVSLLIALLLNRKLRFKSFVRTVTIIPYILIPAVVGVIWNWLYDTNFGILNFYLKAVGLSRVDWLTSANTALISVAIVMIWSYLGYNMLLFLAGLQGIPAELYEAARIDGASDLRAFWRISLPLLRPTTVLVLTLTLINTVQVFDQIFVMTNGGPGTATLTLVQYLYGTAFQNFDLGYGSVIGCVILVILVVLVGLQSRLIRTTE